MDAEIFKKEFLPFHRKLYFVAYRLLENEADAEDLVQEAYLKMWNKRDGLALISNPEAFSIKLVKNMCYDILRSGKSRLSKQMVELTDVSHVFNTDHLECRDDLYMVKKIISALPENQRKVIILRDIKECSYEEIENLTGLNSVNVRVLLSRARKKIREQYIKINNYGNRGS